MLCVGYSRIDGSQEGPRPVNHGCVNVINLTHSGHTGDEQRGDNSLLISFISPPYSHSLSSPIVSHRLVSIIELYCSTPHPLPPHP